MVELNDTYFDKIDGYVSEFKIDVRWVLRNSDDDKPYGSLRIVSHPNLNPGYLRAIFTYITSIQEKRIEDQLKTIEDYQIDEIELEAYSIDSNIKTDKKIYEAPYKELEEIFGVKVFT
jgi:hypothetical protein